MIDKISFCGVSFWLSYNDLQYVVRYDLNLGDKWFCEIMIGGCVYSSRMVDFESYSDINLDRAKYDLWMSLSDC